MSTPVDLATPTDTCAEVGGRTRRMSWVTDGPSWLRRLATLVPPSHTTRFHGVFGPAHRWRSCISNVTSYAGAGAEPCSLRD